MPHRSTVLTDAQLLAGLVAFDSTSARSNLPIADFICAYLDAPDVEIVRNPSADGSKVVIGDHPPLLTDEAAPLHRSSIEMLGQGGSRGVSFASDGGWLSTLGIDCVLWGPGTIDVAHRPDERLRVEDFVRARELLGRFVRRWTGSPAERA